MHSDNHINLWFDVDPMPLLKLHFAAVYWAHDPVTADKLINSGYFDIVANMGLLMCQVYEVE